MALTSRLLLASTLSLALASGALAQDASTSTTTTSSPATTTSSSAATTSGDSESTTTNTSETNDAPDEGQPPSSQHTRDQFSNLLNQHPPELGTILALDPTLLSNEAFLAGYPELERFVARHPEVRRNPRYFLGNYQVGRRQTVFEDVLQGVFVFIIFVFIAFVLGWVVRTSIEQRRWSHLSRTQSDVHTRILERFGTSTELLEYMKTPAGSKFLESAPIPLHDVQVSPNAPASRVLWSIQLGIVVAAGAMGMLLVSGRFDKETAQGMFGMGVIGLCLGGGFVVSAVISLLVSRRLGLWRSPDVTELPDAGSVR